MNEGQYANDEECERGASENECGNGECVNVPRPGRTFVGVCQCICGLSYRVTIWMY